MLKQLNIHHQVVIPRAICQAVGLEPRDLVDIRLLGNSIRIIPISIEPTYSSEELHKLRKLFTRRKKQKTLKTCG